MKNSNFKIVTNLIFFSIFLLFTSISLFQYLTGKHIVNKSFEYEASLLQIDFVSSDYGIIKVIKNFDFSKFNFFNSRIILQRYFFPRNTTMLNTLFNYCISITVPKTYYFLLHYYFKLLKLVNLLLCYA